jgi:hypothetical protein
METILKFDLYLHIAAGTVALITGFIAMVAPKGSIPHRKAGQFYYWAMATICLTALIRFRLTPSMMFLTTIAIFSFYLNFSGRRILAFKNKETQYQAIDWIIAYFALICGFLMGVSCVYFFQQSTTLSILFAFFGIFCISISRNDILRFQGKIEVEKMHWFFHHIGRMMGSYSATVTAFVITNNHGLLPVLVAWIAPGVIIGVLSDVWANRYRKENDIPEVPFLPMRIIMGVLEIFKQLNLSVLRLLK